MNDYLLFLKNCKVGDVIEISNENEIYKYAITGLKPKVESANIP